jgi:hypothetical protein
MSTHSFFPPTPEVQHLPTLFRRIQQGEIRVPAFQRGFVWTEAQILQLLESVYRGFPIGSLLFWNVKEQLLRVERSTISSFPDVAEKYPLKFLLDGLQRLSTLYGVFHWADPSKLGPYNVVFDLDTEEFRHFELSLSLTRSISLSSLFSPKGFLEAQRALTSQEDSETLIERAIRLHSVFQEYMIPTVTIENRSVRDVVAMFERINSTGTKLNAVDFMRAVTWSQDFDLNTEINSLYEDLTSRDFEVPIETLVKVLAVVAGKTPTAASMLELRGAAATLLQNAMDQTRAIVQQAKAFLEEHFAIRSYEYLPYEGQFLVLARFIQLGGHSDPAKIKRVEQWLWATSFNEELRGKPDHYVARILDRIDDLVAGNLSALRSRLTITAEDLLERRFIRGKALSSAFACMVAKREARSLVTGEIIPSELYMREFSTKNFDGLFQAKRLAITFNRDFPSNKIFANTFLFSEDDLLEAKGLTADQLIANCLKRHGQQAYSILLSQFVLPGSLTFLQHGNIVDFLATRASAMVGAAEKIVGQES